MKRIGASILATGLLLAMSACHKSDNMELEPNVVGLTVADATAKLKTYGLVLGTQTMAHSATAAGIIISQTPDAGTSVDGGSAVDVIVSSGLLAISQVTAQPSPFGPAVENYAPAALPLLDGDATVAVHAFAAAPGGGSGTAIGLTPGADGNFYGISTHAGVNQNQGAFFRITPRGVKTVLYSFGARREDAIQPDAPLILAADGNFYSTSAAGGANGDGTVYRISPAGVESVLYSFSSGAGNDPVNPSGGLIQGADGNFYGTTRAGGANGAGALYRLTPAGVLSTLYSFAPASAVEASDASGGMTR